MQEIDVVRQTKIFLQRHGLLGKQITDLYTDAHPSLLIDAKLEPFQRFTLQFDSFAIHPDLVGRLDDGGTTFAVEAKGTDDWLKGIAQADTYRQGFHASILAVAGTPSGDMVSFARQRGIGIIVVRSQGTEVLEQPPLHLPKLDFAESIHRQFSASDTRFSQFLFSFPTHYLSCAVCLNIWEQCFGVPAALIAELEHFVRILYPAMPKEGFRGVLKGAEKLGLVAIHGKAAELTRLGRSCAALLPLPSHLAELHRQSLKQPLATLCPHTAAVLRILLENEPIAKFIIGILAHIGRSQPTPMPVLVEYASRLDKTLTPVVFFFPKVIAELTDDQGFIVWRKVQASHYRTTIYMQYKRILTHAGLIHDHGLAGTTSKKYQPEKDLWELIV
jgi:hypothetical protein